MKPTQITGMSSRFQMASDSVNSRDQSSVGSIREVEWRQMQDTSYKGPRTARPHSAHRTSAATSH